MILIVEIQRSETYVSTCACFFQVYLMEIAVE